MEKFKFSVIIPVYNVENYLEETINSVIDQTIGFEDNIELVLINDGSPDKSEKICLKYKEKYPNNVIYYKQKNSGVSAARNKGIELATGEFSTMLDSDDKWSVDSFAEVNKATIQNPTINIFSCKMVFFDKKSGNHPLNYKYKVDKVVNILEDYDYPQLSSSSIFVRTEVLKKYKYNSEIKYSEDNRLINEIIFDEQQMMMLSKPIYYYRKRTSDDSAINTSTLKEDWYTITPDKTYNYLFALSEKKFGRVIEYIQNVVAYELTWRIALNPKYEISDNVQKKYETLINRLIEKIDDKIIVNQKFMDYATIAYILKVKHHLKEEHLEFKNNKLVLAEREFKKNVLEAFQIDETYVRDNKIIAFGKLDRRFIREDELKAKINNKEIKIEYYDLTIDFNEKTFDNKTLHDFIGVKLVIDLKEYFELSFYYKDTIIVPFFRKESFLTRELPFSYHHIGNNTLVIKNEHLYYQKRSLLNSFKYELQNDLFLFKKHQFKPLLARLSIKFRRMFKTKEIWFISDRVNKADDNGEHFFKYMVENHHDKKIYFVLAKDSVDYERLAKIGKVIDPNTNKYKLLFGSVDYVVSSQAENYVFNPLGTGSECIRDQYDFKYIFLQHGIIKDDLSPWLNVNTKRMDMFVTSAQKEYDSLLNYKYYYGKDVVKLTGLPRYDTLISKQEIYPVENKIMLSLTWRTGLANVIDKETGIRGYNPDFKDSNYFKFLNKLMNDQRLLKVLEEKNYKIRFIPHPNVLTQLKDFTFNDYVEIENGSINYQKEFCTNKILITDYSSVFFDFCYLKKPVIYYQSDREEFFKEQLYDKGYFEYEKDGFGPVYEDYEKFLKGLIEIINNDGKLEEKYLKRIKEFYKYNDTNNCERVYKEIINLKKS